MHWAITGQTAAEIIHTRADSKKPDMGLTNWRGAKVRKEDVPMYMKDGITKLHGFLTIYDRHILTHAGKISHQMAKELAETEYEKFSRKRIQQADAAGGEFEKAIKQLHPPTPKNRGREEVTETLNAEARTLEQTIAANVAGILEA